MASGEHGESGSTIVNQNYVMFRNQKENVQIRKDVKKGKRRKDMRVQ